VVGVVRRMNEVTLRRARLVLGWLTVFGRVYSLPSQNVTSQLGQHSVLHPSVWQVTLCDPIYGTWIPVAVWQLRSADCYGYFTYLHSHNP